MEKNELFLAFYGDDFTGSTDAMEALAKSGFRTVLFLEAPSPALLDRFEGLRCIGVAGTSRAKKPAGMEDELRPVMKQLAKSGAKVVHYKTCSTFDSSPEIGSIGKAIEVSRDYFPDQTVVPLLVGAPALGRFTVFGNHFARMQDTVYRLDRHPVMARHPITPMGESDLRLHLKEQLQEDIALMDILELEGDYDTVQGRYQQKTGVTLFDALDEERIGRSGRLIWETAGEGPEFVVGSSGVEYALTAHWEQAGIAATTTSASKPNVAAADRILAVSGSCSPVSQQQIEIAIQQGFYGMKIPVEQIVNADSVPKEFLEEAVSRLQEGQSVIVYSALGPDDESIVATREHFARMGKEEYDSGEFIGRQLGRWTKYIMQEAGISRVVIAGGDTSGFVTSEMGIYGLEMLLPVSPGAPLCKVYSEDSRMDGMELALKGGQFGSPDYFIKVKDASSN